MNLLNCYFSPSLCHHYYIPISLFNCNMTINQVLNKLEPIVKNKINKGSINRIYL